MSEPQMLHAGASPIWIMSPSALTHRHVLGLDDYNEVLTSFRAKYDRLVLLYQGRLRICGVERDGNDE